MSVTRRLQSRISSSGFSLTVMMIPRERKATWVRLAAMGFKAREDFLDQLVLRVHQEKTETR